MTFKQFFFIPLYIAALATGLMILAACVPANFPLQTWITFQAWAMYFMAGCTIKDGGKVMAGYLGGAVASIAIFELSGLLGGIGLTGNLPLWIAVFIVVIPVICAERVPGFNFVPAWFVGAGVFFGFMTHNTVWPDGACNWTKYCITTNTLMVSCLIGMIFGWVTVTIRGKYEACLAAKQPAAEEAPAEDTPAAEE